MAVFKRTQKLTGHFQKQDIDGSWLFVCQSGQCYLLENTGDVPVTVLPDYHVEVEVLEKQGSVINVLNAQLILDESDYPDFGMIL